MFDFEGYNMILLYQTDINIIDIELQKENNKEMSSQQCRKAIHVYVYLNIFFSYQKNYKMIIKCAIKANQCIYIRQQKCIFASIRIY